MQVSWKMPDLQEESEEISERAADLGIDPQELFSALQNGKRLILSDDMWKNLLNTDSYDIRSITDIWRLSKRYGKDFKSIVYGFENGEPMPLPIVIMKPTGELFLVGGNTRLMVCKILRIQPQILLGTI